MMGLRTRIGLTAVVLAGGWGLAQAVGPGALATVTSGDLAALQFAHTDAAALAYAAASQAMERASWWVGLATLAVLVALWVTPAWRRARGVPTLAALLALAVATVTASHPARAYFSTTDKTEAVTIMPNESAFWIPDTGGNKDSQASMDSEAYYAANKIALSRFVIPHAKLGNTGGWVGFDSYVPTGRMIIVDRAPYYREWTMSVNKRRPGPIPKALQQADLTARSCGKAGSRSAPIEPPPLWSFPTCDQCSGADSIGVLVRRLFTTWIIQQRSHCELPTENSTVS